MKTLHPKEPKHQETANLKLTASPDSMLNIIAEKLPPSQNPPTAQENLKGRKPSSN